MLALFFASLCGVSVALMGFVGRIVFARLADALEMQSCRFVGGYGTKLTGEVKAGRLKASRAKCIMPEED